MIRRIAIDLPEDEAQKAEHFARRLNMPLPAFCALAVTQLTEAYIEADHSEAVAMLDFLANSPAAGNA